MYGYREPEEAIVGYTAGFVDGEGSIWFNQSQRRYHVSSSQSEANDGESLMRGLRDDWGGIGSISGQRKLWGEARWIQWCWGVSATREIDHFLTTLLPHLRVKRALAEQALVAIRVHSATGHRTRWTPEEDALLLAGDLHDWEVSERFGRSESAIRHRRRQLGIHGDRRKRPGLRRR